MKETMTRRGATFIRHTRNRKIGRAVKSKAEMDAMAIVKDTVAQAKITANKEAKKIRKAEGRKVVTPKGRDAHAGEDCRCSSESTVGL